MLPIVTSPISLPLHAPFKFCFVGVCCCCCFVWFVFEKVEMSFFFFRNNSRRYTEIYVNTPKTCPLLLNYKNYFPLWRFVFHNILSTFKFASVMNTFSMVVDVYSYSKIPTLVMYGSVFCKGLYSFFFYAQVFWLHTILFVYKRKDENTKRKRKNTKRKNEIPFFKCCYVCNYFLDLI